MSKSQFQLHFTNHARKRMAQRGISEKAIRMVIEHGRESVGRRAFLYFLGEKEVRKHKQKRELRRHQNIHVVIDLDGTVRTVYRNAQPNLRDKRIRRAKRPRN